MDIRFCDECDASIPELDIDRGVAIRLNGRLLCSLCAPRAKRQRILAMAIWPLTLLAAVALGAATAVWLLTPTIDDLNLRVTALTTATEVHPAVDASVLEALQGLGEMDRSLADARKRLGAAVADRDDEVTAALADCATQLSVLGAEIREIREFLAAAAEEPVAEEPADVAPPTTEPAPEQAPAVDLATWLLLAADPDAGVRLSALVALEPAHDPRVLAAARSALGDGDAVVRAQGARMVADRGDEESVPDLIELLADRNSRVRVVAQRALETLTGLDLDFDTTDSEDAREGAVQAIRELLSK